MKTARMPSAPLLDSGASTASSSPSAAGTAAAAEALKCVRRTAEGPFASTFAVGKVLRLCSSVVGAAQRGLRNAILAALCCGHPPKHVAFVMDGNRRYAERVQRTKTEGHRMGWGSLLDTLEWCYYLGVRCVTVFAFSIENFKRDPDEVAHLFSMFVEKLDQICTLDTLLKEQSVRVRVRVIGRRDLLPPEVQAAAERAENITAANLDGPVLNVCLPYTSTDEMQTACKLFCHEAAASAPCCAECDTNAFERCLSTAGQEPPEIIFRTGGERRLSDFLLWQASAHSTRLVFIAQAWPEFSFWHALPALLQHALDGVYERIWQWAPREDITCE